MIGQEPYPVDIQDNECVKCLKEVVFCYEEDEEGNVRPCEVCDQQLCLDCWMGEV